MNVTQPRFMYRRRTGIRRYVYLILCLPLALHHDSRIDPYCQ